MGVFLVRIYTLFYLITIFICAFLFVTYVCNIPKTPLVNPRTTTVAKSAQHMHDDFIAIAVRPDYHATRLHPPGDHAHLQDLEVTLTGSGGYARWYADLARTV